MGKETGKQSNILFQGALLHNAENGKSLMFPEEGAKFIKINCFFCFFFCSLKIIHKRVSPKILYAVRKQTQKNSVYRLVVFTFVGKNERKKCPILLKIKMKIVAEDY